MNYYVKNELLVLVSFQPKEQIIKAVEINQAVLITWLSSAVGTDTTLVVSVDMAA